RTPPARPACTARCSRTDRSRRRPASVLPESRRLSAFLIPHATPATVANVRSQPARITASAARRVALAAQGFDRQRPAATNLGHVRRMLDRIAVVQIDSVNVVARAHELPLWARLGAYPRGAIAELAYRRREWFEYWAHAASYVPVELQPHLRWRMAQAHVEA